MAAFPPILPIDEVRSTHTVVKREKKRARLEEGSLPAVGKVNAPLEVIERRKREDEETRKVRLMSLGSFGHVFVPPEVVVPVYVFRGIELQQIGAQYNPYRTTRLYGAYPDFYTQSHNPIIDEGNRNFFEMFESHVKTPGGSVHIEMKVRMLPEAVLPTSYAMMTRSEEGNPRIGWLHRELPVNIGKLGFGWSERIGKTARLGNRSEDERRSSTCQYVADGIAQYNWRLKWSLQLPSLDEKSGLNLQIFGGTSLGLGSDQLCALAYINPRSLIDEIVTTEQRIIKKKQWTNMEHPNHHDSRTPIQVSFELTTAKMADTKNCFENR
ncbi:hypothetical protein FGB62_107g07 [Gracilaria domingensis]|nr:hypothetical protein FGB62_107g07 [Gracilaria domingensis]